jgi:RNA polymerase sigma-70 factor (ECF subfamily)
MVDLVAPDGAERAAARASEVMDARLEAHRVELTGYCYRMLGSGFEAEDAVQETLVRAWQKFDRFSETRAPLRSWLYAIATNVCLDMLRNAQRRARAVDLGPASPLGAPLGDPLPHTTWVQPIPDRRVLPANSDPAELVAQRETIRLAFVAALQHLPPRQRAVLILREVLCWRAGEVAQLLDSTVASVNSALQRARSTLEAMDIEPAEPLKPMDTAQQDLLSRYAEAFERYDVDTLVSLLHEDATTSMPPFAWWLRGRDAIRAILLAAGQPCEGARLVPTVANGQPAFWQYRPSEAEGGYEPFALVIFDLSAGLITGTTTYLDAEHLYPLFDTPSGSEPAPR